MFKQKNWEQLTLDEKISLLENKPNKDRCTKTHIAELKAQKKAQMHDEKTVSDS